MWIVQVPDYNCFCGVATSILETQVLKKSSQSDVLKKLISTCMQIVQGVKSIG